jgi:argininosuccinate lyase
MTSLWGGRFEGRLAPEMLALSRSTHFDVRLVRQDCRVLAAHAGVLASSGILSSDEAATVRDALPSIAADIESGTFAIEQGDEDIHTTVERALAARVPAAAAKVRAGLSRNDRVATAFRIWSIEHAALVADALAQMVGAMTERARETAEAIMPGYTHLQRAQPVTAGVALAAHAHALVRDVERIEAAASRASVMPLGAGALAGSTLGLDHAPAAAELGFGSAFANPIDAVSSRDFACELLAAFAIAGVHLSRLAEEIVLWTSSEFGFATLDDAYATGSSLMPQKKNADVAELTRGKAGRLIDNLTSLLVVCKGLPLAYNRDLQEDKEALFDSVDTLLLTVPALTGAVATMRFDTARMADAAADPLLVATDLAERLVSAGMPFRDAHEAVGRAVRVALDAGRDWNAFTHDDWDAVHPMLAKVAPGALDAAVSARERLGDPGDAVAALDAWLAGRPE